LLLTRASAVKGEGSPDDAAIDAAAAVSCQHNPSVTQLASTPPLDVLPPLNRVSWLHVLLIAPA
jgi:hypothetical protein